MPAATLAGTIEGAAQRLKQLLASLSQDVRVMIPSRNDAKDFLRTEPWTEESFRCRSPHTSSFAK
ncbi:hypothetical protein CDS [Bradyrhizobium sp.]|nr:hypothetical protein CDS [Bradyrhizobium sp.]